MSEDIYLSIVIPAYNEEARLGQTLERLLDYLGPQPYSFEIVVVNDGSADKTAEVARDAALADTRIRLLENGRNMGKGFTVKNGVLNAAGRYILFFDADFSTPIESLKDFFPQLESGFDVVIGSRKMKGSIVEVYQHPLRKFMGKVFTALTNIILWMRLSDITCGFKVFSKDCAREVFRRQRIAGWAFDAEILFLAKRFGFKIKEVPVRWRNYSDTKVRLVKDAIQSFIGLIKIRANALSGVYR